MRESQVWQTFKTILSPEFNLNRHEDKITPGYPDVSVLHKLSRCAGFVELKVEDGTHWVSPEQALFARRYKEDGGRILIVSKKSYGNWFFYQVQPTYEWVRDIQRRLVPGVESSRLLPDFIDFWLES